MGDAGSRRGGGALGVGNGRRSACRRTHRTVVGDRRLPLRKRRRLDGPSFGAVRADRLGRGRRRGALLAGISRALPRTQIPGPHLAALHRAGDDVLRHVGRSDLRRRIFIPLFLGADDRRIVPADPVRRRAPRSAPRRAGLRDHDARGIRPAAHRLRAVGQRLRIGRLRPVGRIFPHAARPAAVRGLPCGLRHEGRHVPDARLAARSASRRPVARLRPDVGRDDQDGRLRHPARHGADRRPADAPHRRPDPARRRHRHGTLGRDPRRGAERREAAAGLLVDRKHRHRPDRTGHRGAGQEFGQPARGDLRTFGRTAPHAQPLAVQIAALLRSRQHTLPNAHHLARRAGRAGQAHACHGPAVSGRHDGHLRPAAAQRIRLGTADLPRHARRHRFGQRRARFGDRTGRTGADRRSCDSGFHQALRHGVPRRAPHARSGRSLRGR